jgi:hypothetical protein
MLGLPLCERGLPSAPGRVKLNAGAVTLTKLSATSPLETLNRATQVESSLLAETLPTTLFPASAATSSYVEEVAAEIGVQPAGREFAAAVGPPVHRCQA